MNLDPAQRYHSASDFAEALGRNPLKLDWQPRFVSDDHWTWTAPKGKGRTLHVELKNQGGRSAVETYTESPAKGRCKKGENVYWRKGLTFKQAMSYLKQLFRQLG